MSIKAVSSVGQYEFTLFVSRCSVSVKFPCTFSITWKIAHQAVCTIQPQQQSGSILTFNQQIRSKANIVTKQAQKTAYAPKSTICLNFATPNKPHEPKTASVLTIDLAKMLEGVPQKEYPLVGSMDKKSWLRISVACRFLRFRELEEIKQSPQLMKLLRDAEETKEKSEEPPGTMPLSKSIQKMLDKLFTPKKPSPKQSPKEGSVIKNKETIYETPKARNTSLIATTVTPPPVTQPKYPHPTTQTKGQIDLLLAKFESQQRLRQSLELQLNAIKSKTDYISQRLQDSERKTREAAEISRNQPQMSILQQENRHLKEELREVKYAYQQQTAISTNLQRQLRLMTDLYEKERSNSDRLHRQVVQLISENSSRHSPPTHTPETSKCSTERSFVKDQPKLERELLKTQATLKEKEDYCNNIQGELEEVRKQLQQMRSELANKSASRLEARSRAYTEQAREYTRADWEKRIHELEEELVEKDNRIQQLEEQATPEEVLAQFNKKEEEIKQAFAIIQKECNTLIDTVQNRQSSRASLGIQTIDNEAPMCRGSPVAMLHRQATEKIEKSPQSFQQEQVNKIRSQNQSLKQQTKELQQSLRDSRRSFLQFKQLIFKQSDKPHGSVRKAERSASRYRHHMRHIDRLKIEYTDKLRQMYNEIVHLNEIIYQNSAKQKQMAVEVQAISEKYLFMEKASREMRQHLQECRATHLVTLTTQLETIQSQKEDILRLKATIEDQAEKISSLKVQMQNMDNSDLLIVNNHSEEDLHLELSRMQAENKQLERKHGEMMAYIEELRAEHQRVQEQLIIREAEVEQLKECRLSRRNSRRNGKENYEEMRSPIDEGPSFEEEDASVVIAEALLDISDLLKVAFRGNQQIKEAKGPLKSVLDLRRGNADELIEGRTQRFKIIQKIRQASIEFQRLKLDRLKSLEGSSELRKEFLKSVRLLQSKFDELLDFGQGVLNRKITDHNVR